MYGKHERIGRLDEIPAKSLAFCRQERYNNIQIPHEKGWGHEQRFDPFHYAADAWILERQKLIAQYISEHYDKAAFMTAAKLGMTVGVSESTVVRFASELGFEGYPQLQRALQELIRNRLTSVQRMEVTSDQLGEGNILHKF